MRIGILALQGAVAAHRHMLLRLGAVPVDVRRPHDLEQLAGLILPGGESTAMLTLIRSSGMWHPLLEFTKARPVLGVCAGAILLARRVSGPRQPSLERIDVHVNRNGYGRQNDSFKARLTPTELWGGGPVEGIFIRAPRIRAVFGRARTLLRIGDGYASTTVPDTVRSWNPSLPHRDCAGEPVLVQQGYRLAATFHPELSESDAIHEYFLRLCESSCRSGPLPAVH